MRRFHTPLVVAAVVLVLATGCSKNNEEPQDGPTATPAVSDLPTTITAPAQPTQGQPATGTTPPTTVTGSPDASQTQELTTRLDAISPGLGDDENRVLLAAASVCQRFVQGDDDATLSSTAKDGFTVEGGAQLSDEQSRAVVDAVTSTFCHA
jgi:hypothetical protein